MKALIMDTLETPPVHLGDVLNIGNDPYPIEGDWGDEEDEDFDDRLDAVVDTGEEDEDHLPDDDLQ